jgi:hypothetical protein
MNTYECFGPGGRRCTVQADTSYSAQCKAAEVMGAHPKKRHAITVVLVESEGEPVVRDGSELP